MEQMIEMSPLDLEITEAQAARHNTPEHDTLTENIACNGIIQPIRIRPPKKVLTGAGRVLAARKLGLQKVPCVVADSDPEHDGFITASENNARTAFTTIERVDQAQEAAARFPQMRQKDLANRLGESVSDMCRLLKVATCEVTCAALKSGRLVGLSEAYAVAQAPAEAKQGLIELKLSGGKRDDIAKLGRKTRGTTPPTEIPERTTRVRIPLAVKVDAVSVTGTVTVAGPPGEEVDLSGTERLLAQALRAVKDAQKLGLGVKAAQSSWKDMAAKDKR